MTARLAAFADVRSQGARFALEMGVPLGAYQKMTAEEFFLMLSDPSLGGPFATDPGISDAQGMVCAIVKCSPGQGPYLHAHYNTLESFTCLDGRFRITWGDTGEHEAFLDPFDTISVPRGVVRTFANASDGTAHILGFIRGDTPEDFADVAMTPAAAGDLDATFGSGTSDQIRDIGWRFDAGVTAPTAQVSPAEMAGRIARFADQAPLDPGQAAAIAIPGAGAVRLMVGPEDLGAPVSGDPGMLVTIAELAPGAATGTYSRGTGREAAMCLGGTLELSGAATLVRRDMAAFGPDEPRAWRNIGTEPAHLLSIVTGVAGDDFATVTRAG
jgi:quercetin dioxygenase-like cupin family protein